MDKRQRVINIETFARSAPAAVALQAELKRRDDANEPDPTDEECIAICEKANALATYGHDAKQDSRGNYIQQGIGSPGHETANHFASILRWAGRDAHREAVAEIFRRDPDRARKIGLTQART